MKLFGKAKPVVGVSEKEFNDLREEIRLEFVKTQEAHKKPTEYMRGLQFALDVIDKFDAHEL